MDGKNILFMISAGEASGDLHAAGLVRELKSIYPHAKIFGMGGRAMEAEGVKVLVRSEKISVVGITEVFSKVRGLVGAQIKLRRAIEDLRPSLLILVDFPDFNLMLAKKAKREGLKVFYYIPPQVWAWRRRRIKELRRFVDQMALILPFEEGFYRTHGIVANFVGNPLLDMLELEKLEQREAQLEPAFIPRIALLPGSREMEVKRNLPAMFEAARALAGQLKDLKVRISVAPSINPGLILSLTGPLPHWAELVPGNATQALKGCLAAVVVSGTATLEAAIMGIPMVVVYKVSWPSYQIGKRLAKVSHISLVNLIADRALVPELIQERASPSSILEELLILLNNRQKRDEIVKGLNEVKKSLGTPGASKRAALLIRGLLGV